MSRIGPGTLNVGSICQRKTEVCEELTLLSEVRGKGQEVRFVGTLGQR